MEQSTSKEADKKKKREMNKKVWWGPIENKELAEHIVNETAKGFYILAGLQAIIGILLFPGYILNAILLALIAYWMHKTKSRVAAIILLILSVLSVIGTLMAMVGEVIGGTNIILAILFLWLSIRATQATGKLSGLKRSE